MSKFFELIESKHNFSNLIRIGIMEYSLGAPGVFGSLIRFAIDKEMYESDRCEWNYWFKVCSFSDYLKHYNQTYERFQEDLKNLNEQGWKALNVLLANHSIGNNQFVTDEAIKFGFEALQEMGIAIKNNAGDLKFSSEMVRRICLEAVPLREISEAVYTDDPLQLLMLSLRFINPETIKHNFVQNKESPSEAVFQFELYSSIRGIFKKYSVSPIYLLAEARGLTDQKKLDILITNGKKHGYELKSNQRRESEIKAAVEQANGYREKLKLDSIFLVNFVPRNGTCAEIYKVRSFPRVNIIYVRFPDTCDEFEVRYQVGRKKLSQIVSTESS
jgi:hypothetical protein